MGKHQRPHFRLLEQKVLINAILINREIPFYRKNWDFHQLK